MEYTNVPTRRNSPAGGILETTETPDYMEWLKLDPGLYGVFSCLPPSCYLSRIYTHGVQLYSITVKRLYGACVRSEGIKKAPYDPVRAFYPFHTIR